jgi:pimeloyl-ACP methyl ester carboxylesterase
MRRTLFCFLLAFAVPLQASLATERWQTLPPTPAPVPGLHAGHAKLNGISLFYAEIGHGSPVIVLHGGLANSDYLGNQVRALARYHRVVVVDSRGHGRSTRDQQPFGYDLMTDDVLALLDTLKIQKADIVGWSDGAIIGLDMAMRHPDRVGRVFAFGANTQTSGLKDGFDQNPVFAGYMKRARQEYARLSPTSDQYDAFQNEIGKMWADQPNWTDAQLGSIKSPVLVVDGDHDEGIKREHAEYIAATIPGAGLLILPNVSHFAFLQDPVLFNAALLHFLGDQ